MKHHKGLRRACVAAGAAIALVALSSCSEPYKGTGSVVGREYDDPDSGVTPGHWADGGQDCGYEYEWVSGYEFNYATGDYEYVSGYENVYVCEDRPDVYIPPMPWSDGPHWHLVIEDAD